MRHLRLDLAKKAAPFAGFLLLVYAAIASVLFFAIPGPHGAFECMVIGTGSAAATVFALFFGLIRRSRT